jgi:hypothetical protein
MVPTISTLTGADEALNHQIVNTHSAVVTPDRSWAEKIWFTLARKDGALQADFGLGKYPNRNVLDGFAGVQHGDNQRTVRASRVLRPGLEDMAVGPIRYEVIEPFRKIRLTLAENTVQPLKLDLTFTDRLPAFFEGRDVVLAQGRTASDVIRYHQAGTVSGWIEIGGERIAVEPDDWFGFRDHSWGVREHVGLDPADLVPADLAPTAQDKDRAGKPYHFNWAVSQLTRPDGSRYEIAYYFRDFGGEGRPDFFTGFINEADGRQTQLLRVVPELTYRKADKAIMGGRLYALHGGKGRALVERVFEVEAIDPGMGFRLLPGLYGNWKGQIHGSFKGENYLDGECVEDANNPENTAANYRWQIRDRPLRIREGEAAGFANIESIIIGDYPGVTFV